MNQEQHDDRCDSLEEQLRDIEIPTGLKDRLLAIPEASPVEVAKKRYCGRLRITLAVMAVAASLVGAISLARWRLVETPRLTNHAEPSPIETQPDRDELVPKLSSHPDEIRMVEMIVEGQAEIDQILQQMELERLRAELAALKRVRRPAQLNPIDELSMILVLSGQAELGFGGDAESIQEDLQMVIKRYPDSRGAALASTLVSNTEL